MSCLLISGYPFFPIETSISLPFLRTVRCLGFATADARSLRYQGRPSLRECACPPQPTLKSLESWRLVRVIASAAFFALFFLCGCCRTLAVGSCYCCNTAPCDGDELRQDEAGGGESVVDPYAWQAESFRSKSLRHFVAGDLIHLLSGVCIGSMGAWVALIRSSPLRCAALQSRAFRELLQ